MNPIRVLIVDDEPPARKVLRLRLAKEADIRIIGEAGSGPAAVEQITRLRPDLVFLDIQMPVMGGFEVLEQVAGVHLPVVVFVTAYDEYAVKAFDAHALDYLLKPFTLARFKRALERAREELAREGDLESHRRLLELVRAHTSGRITGEYLMRLPVKKAGRYQLVDVERIDWIESAANYLRLHVGEESFLIRRTMKELERDLDPKRFARIHRSLAVNIDRVAEIRPDASGDFTVRLRDGTRLRMTRTYRTRLLP